MIQCFSLPHSFWSTNIFYNPTKKNLFSLELTLDDLHNVENSIQSVLVKTFNLNIIFGMEFLKITKTDQFLNWGAYIYIITNYSVATSSQNSDINLEISIYTVWYARYCMKALFILTLNPLKYQNHLICFQEKSLKQIFCYNFIYLHLKLFRRILLATMENTKIKQQKRQIVKK